MPNPRNFGNRIPHVTAGSSVSAGNTSASTRALEQRTNYLREVLEAIEAGSLLVRRDQRVAVEVQEGDAVFWNVTTQQYEQALAAVTNDADTGLFSTLPSADCLGLCMIKDNPRAATIAMMGMVKFPAAVLSNMIDGTPVPGRYYLSAADPGKLVKQRPPISVAIAFVLGPITDCESDVWVQINPQMRDFLEDHIHYQVELVAAPAGTHVPPSVGDDHEITDADAELQGWLPADHAVFNGKAPTGAVFGYNLSAHPALKANWPPIPVSSAVLEMHQRPVSDIVSQFEGYSRVPATYVTMDNYGIWWMTRCYNQVPWDTLLDTETPVNGSMSSVALATCPEDPPTALLLSFVKMTFTTDKTVVTSLQPAADEPIRFVNCDGSDATTGQLFAKLDVQSLVDPALVQGGLVLKEVVDSKLHFRQGWVTEGLYAGSDEVILNGTTQRLLNPSLPEGVSNPRLHQGIIRLDVQRDTSEREIHPQVVRLADVIEREYKGITCLAFQPGRTSAMRMRYNVPINGLPTNPQFLIRAVLFGRAAGPMSAMTMTYYRIPRPVAGTPSTIGEGDTAITFDIVTPSDNYDGLGTNLPADRAIEVSSAAFDISPGDTIFVELKRLATATPLFQAEVAVIRAGGIIVPGSV